MPVIQPRASVKMKKAFTPFRPRRFAYAARLVVSTSMILSLSTPGHTMAEYGDDYYAEYDTSLLASSPLQRSALTYAQIPATYQQVWQRSPTRNICPILALPKQMDSHIPNITTRPANFSGGWGVAYDLPNYRSYYGVANAGTTTRTSIKGWQDRHTYADGTFVTYGHAGHDPNANMLAYLVLPNGCFYNLWSGNEVHLIEMLNTIAPVRP